MGMGKRIKCKPQQLQSILQNEGSGCLEVPYLGYVEVCLKIPEVKAFDQDVLLLNLPTIVHIHDVLPSLQGLFILIWPLD